MSKVHEALKRAREDRAIAAPPRVDTGNGVHEIETSFAVAIPVPDSPAISSAPLVASHGDKENGKRTIEAPSSSAIAAQASPAILSSPVMTIAQALAPTKVEHRPHVPAAGRDPRTGQFLRFEDLLKSCAKPAWVLDPRTVAFCESNREVSGTEQFRTLRTRLYQLRETSPLKKVLVTSALAAEGKTFVATNLAQAIARERDRRVLLIDADLRSPALHKPLGAPIAPGLSDYLRDQVTDPEIIQHGQEGNLCFIGAGSAGSNPSELLSNGALEKLLERVAPLFDWVILDSPPCLPVADANVLAGLCDGVLLVVRARSTPSAAADRARKELQKRKVLGVVMNAVDEADGYGAYYSYGYGNTAAAKRSRESRAPKVG